MMTRRSAAESTVSVRPTEIASVAELIRRPPLAFQRSNQVRGDRNRTAFLPQQHEGWALQNFWLLSTSTQNFSNARDSGLFSPFAPPLFLPDPLRDCPEGSGRPRARFVAAPGKGYRNDFIHASGAQVMTTTRSASRGDSSMPCVTKAIV